MYVNVCECECVCVCTLLLHGRQVDACAECLAGFVALRQGLERMGSGNPVKKIRPAQRIGGKTRRLHGRGEGLFPRSQWTRSLRHIFAR